MSQSLSRGDALSSIATVAAASPVALPALAAGGAGQDIVLRRLWVRYCEQEAAHIVAGEKMSPVRAAFDTEMGKEDDRWSDAGHARFWATWDVDGDDEDGDGEDSDEEECDDKDGDDKDDEDDEDEDGDDKDGDDAAQPASSGRRPRASEGGPVGLRASR
jgi:hypothetical protein